MAKAMKRIDIIMASESEILIEIGHVLKTARLSSAMTQEQVADLAGISRPRYRDIETGVAAARTTTLINIARALGMEVMLVPQAVVPAVEALLQPNDGDDFPAFISRPDDDDHG